MDIQDFGLSVEDMTVLVVSALLTVSISQDVPVMRHTGAGKDEVANFSVCLQICKLGLGIFRVRQQDLRQEILSLRYSTMARDVLVESVLAVLFGR